MKEQNELDPIAEARLRARETPLPVENERNGWRTFSIALVVATVLIIGGYLLVTRILFPSQFTPVELSKSEQQQLDQKLTRLGIEPATQSPPREPLTPEPYSEAGASREVRLSERELNGLLAHNTDLANKMVIDLADDLASLKMLIDLDPDLPLVGGKTLKVTAGMEIDLNPETPRMVLKGVSVWGVPLPNEWLGNLKNVNMVQQFGEGPGFWKSVVAGIEEMEIHEQGLRIKLKE